MYDFLTRRPEEVYTGLYFESEPRIPMQESGKPFSYSVAGSGSERNENVYTNVEYTACTMGIETTRALPWRPEAYVVLGEALWRIESIGTRILPSQVCLLVRRPRTVYLLSIVRCHNPVGVKRV